ncbi:ABC transporter substrate-binding protein [Vibrio nigripulchritudo]|uniref:ABC transporter substrate-binding protein n=1 Tax=Vibrio nigripulchritudo TaxID=28173 RepID=UPI002492F22E|nr:ABC transporter substrate-binding protein [Vibrio nigripulchritudo]BDU37203.1 periplasmic alpha-galactoside-binding protein [Vibrio nigripulchritudo]BDU42923.1 periplasmic alpha-galactoside-binding protein [Vibrio nigripulchritudo]
MRKHSITLSVGMILGSLSIGTTNAAPMPEEVNLGRLKTESISPEELYSYQSLEKYSQAPFLDKLVSDKTLPPVKERLPKTPLVFKAKSMPDGIGEYGGVFRHVIGARPQGWNWMAGLHQGWGGINMSIQECLVRQGPRWQISSEFQTGPLPNLAKSWTWSSDKKILKMNLVEGIRWSDGDSFDTEDIRFWWEDNVQDENVASRLPKDGFGVDTKLEIISQYEFAFHFAEPKTESLLESLAYIQGCPGPSHVLKNFHPRYQKGKTYDEYTNAFPADDPSTPVLGAWVPVLHKADELVVLRRNPYYWKVDEKGQQLPYFNEVHFKLSTWDDRTTQAVAGTGDFSNMENPGNYVEVLKQTQGKNSNVAAFFGPRVLAWRLELNFSLESANDDVEKEIRQFFRNKDFRVALSQSIDRNAVGQTVARGPFAYPYTGGLATGSPFYSKKDTFYIEPNSAEANKALDALGLKDTDNNGIRNLPSTGEDFTVDVIFKSNRNEDRKQVDSIASQLAEVGIRILPKGLDEASYEAQNKAGKFNAAFGRVNSVLPTRETCTVLPIATNCPPYHQDVNGQRDMLPFEQQLIDAYDKFVSTDVQTDKINALNRIQQLLTENVYSIGTIQIPAALLVNKRIQNVHPGTPVFMYEWAEDSVIRERLWVPKSLQKKELMPGVIAKY